MMTKRELKEICERHDNCANCHVRDERPDVVCPVVVGAYGVIPEDYPDGILDEEVDRR